MKINNYKKRYTNLNESLIEKNNKDELYFCNNIDKDLMSSASDSSINGDNLVLNNNIKCSKSAINNVLYLLKHGKNCNLCMGQFQLDEKHPNWIGHVWVKTEDGKILQTGVPLKHIPKGGIDLHVVKSIEFKSEDVDKIKQKLANAGLNESLTEDLDQTETGMSSVLMDLINQEYNLLSLYESAQITFEDHDENKFNELFEYIKDDINIHIGMLQAAIEDLNPSAEKIEDGKEQGENLIDDNSIDEAINPITGKHLKKPGYVWSNKYNKYLKIVDFPVLSKKDYNPEDDIYDELYGEECDKIMAERGIYCGQL